MPFDEALRQSRTAPPQEDPPADFQGKVMRCICEMAGALDEAMEDVRRLQEAARKEAGEVEGLRQIVFRLAADLNRLQEGHQ